MHLKTSHRPTNRARPLTVHFPLPRKAVSKLRALAIGKDPRLLDLGVLAVQISHDESIVLGIELDKTKKKSAVYVNKAASSSFSHSPQERVSFNTKASGPRNFTTAPTFGSSSYNYTGVHAGQHLSTARNDNLVAKAKNSAAKRRAKETLNAARRGRGRGRVGKSSGQKNPSIKASTWEMVYSHIGLPGEHRNKASNLLEPPVGSQASGIAHVPVAQTEFPKESILKSERKRKSSASSPPIKSPAHGGVYSEDDSSVSSSPCSHSPMNSEELMNLFVDSNLSATSVLKQLAESRSKEAEKQTDVENDSDKSVGNKSFDAGVDGQAKRKEPGSSMAGKVVDGLPQWGIFPKKSGSPVSKMENNDITVKNGPTISPSFGVGPNLSKLNSTSNSSTTSLTTNNTSIKRPASSLGQLYSSSSLSLPKKSSLLNLQASKRAKTEVEVKREMVKISNTSELNLQKSQDTPASSTHMTQALSHFGMSSSPPSNSQFNISSTAAPTTNVAVRNFRQYGYYYSAEELSRALAKTASLKNKSTPQPSLYTSASSSSNVNLSTSTNSHGTPTLLKPNSPDEQPATKGPTMSCLPLLSSSSQPSFDSCQKTNNSPKIEAVSSDIFDMDKSPTLLSDIQGNSLSSLNEKAMPENSQSEVSNTSSISSTSGTLAVTATTSSSTALTSSGSVQPREAAADTSSSIQKNGKCYAISYVYPMGTVWYPYVAITPYAVLQKNASESQDSEKEKKETEGADNGAYNTSSQYIDLASSLRYWQQLSLLYKNQMLVTASNNTNVLSSTVDQNTGTNGSLNSVASDISRQSLTASMMDSKSERAKDSFSLSESCTVSSTLQQQPIQSPSSNSRSSSEKKPVRRPSVIVAAKTSHCLSSSNNSEESFQHSSSRSTPESDASSEGMQMRTEGLVIDNCNRLIEEHCQRMNEVLADTPGDFSGSHTENTKCSSTTPSLSFIPDSSIAYVNVGNNNGLKKTVGNGKDGKSKSSKKKKTNKTV